MKRYLSSLILGAALLSPVVASAQPLRYYDRDHRDYHEWNDAEARAHRHWLIEEQHRKYREFRRTSHRDQANYWRWRHEHQDWR